MFGTLKPAHAALDCRTRGEWRRFYCGTCQGIGDQFGLGYRGLLSHDAVFLGLLVDALVVEAAPPNRTRCPMLPVVHRPTVSPSSVAMRYAAAVQLLLAEQWVADRAIDGRSFARIARPLLAKPAAQARATLAALGSDLAELIGIEDRQAAMEIRGATGPEDAAEPTAAALALVFERIAGLPGVVAELGDAREQLARLGRAVGTQIYLVDALEDLDRDRRAGDFNPCLIHDYAGRPEISVARVRAARRMLDDAGRQIAEALAALPLRRHAAVLRNILITQLGGRARLAVAGAERLVAEAGVHRRLLEQLAAQTGILRFTQALVAVAIAMVTGLWSRLVEAAGETGGSESGTDTDTGAETGGEVATSTPDIPTEVESTTGPGTPDVDIDIDTNVSHCACTSWLRDLISGCCGGLADACGELGASLGACGSCFDSCGGACNSCGNSCGNGCSSCGNLGSTCCGEGNLCAACGDCGDSCSGCGNCGNCGNTCSGCGECGNVCSGCGDCGNACSGCGNCGNCGSGCGNCGNCGNCGGGGCNC